MKADLLLKTLQQITLKTTYFGPQGFALPRSENELAKFQEGYRTHNGSDLTGNRESDWLKSWLVIAIDTELGDPYFVDTSLEQLPVYTAMHGDGAWQVEMVATSLNGFRDCLNLLAAQSKQTTAQFVPDETTITDKIALAKLQDNLVKASGCENFWSLFFDCYVDWLEED